MTEPGVVRELPSPRDVLTVEARFPHLPPRTVWKYWTRPDLITQWWPNEAEIDARVNGPYVLSWPSMDWYLRGTFDQVEPPHALGFSWSWDHELDVPATHVSLSLAPLHPDGTLLTLTHGPYPDTPDGHEQRQSNLDGWTHFLSKLYQLEIPASPS